MQVIIILGNSKPDILKKRVDRAVEEFFSSDYEYEIPGGKVETKYILISGKPSAKRMKEYTMSKGVEERFIKLEDKSMNTIENITFCKKMLDQMASATYEHNKPVVTICTSSFHIKRSIVLTKMILDCYETNFIHTRETVTREEYEREHSLLGNSIDYLCEKCL